MFRSIYPPASLRTLRAFGLLSSSLLCFPQHFGRYVLRPSSGMIKIVIININSYFWLISYIFLDASGWVISDVSFGFIGGFGSCSIRPSRPNDPVGIDLTQTSIPAANLRIHTRQNDHRKGSLYIFLQQPIRAKLFWWLLNLSFKIGRPLCSCFPAAMTSLFGYLFSPVCSLFLFPFHSFPFSFFFSKLTKKIN